MKAFLERDGHSAALGRLTPAILRTAPAQPFVISDHPITRTNAFPYGDAGLQSPGVLVYLPISPTLTIALHCPTIVSRYEGVVAEYLEPDRRDRILAYRDGLRAGEAIDIDPDLVLNLNERQVTQSTRYLYGATDDFAFAREFLNRNPKARAVETHIAMGEIGRGPARRTTMPPGRHLVIYGAIDHCMLRIGNVDESGEGITACTDDVALLALVAADDGSLRAELYDDGQQVRLMGQATAELLHERGAGWFRIVDRDPSIRNLMMRLDSERAE